METIKQLDTFKLEATGVSKKIEITTKDKMITMAKTNVIRIKTVEDTKLFLVEDASEDGIVTEVRQLKMKTSGDNLRQLSGILCYSKQRNYSERQQCR